MKIKIYLLLFFWDSLQSFTIKIQSVYIIQNINLKTCNLLFGDYNIVLPYIETYCPSATRNYGHYLP